MDWLNNFITNPDVLTPQGVFEIFIFFIVIELIGIFFSWIRGAGR